MTGTDSIQANAKCQQVYNARTRSMPGCNTYSAVLDTNYYKTLKVLNYCS